MKVLKVIKSVDDGEYILSLMGARGLPTHVHINNYKTNKNSVIVPLGSLNALLKSTGACTKRNNENG